LLQRRQRAGVRPEPQADLRDLDAKVDGEGEGVARQADWGLEGCVHEGEDEGHAEEQECERQNEELVERREARPGVQIIEVIVVSVGLPPLPRTYDEGRHCKPEALLLL
jgi:hypothetical protein